MSATVAVLDPPAPSSHTPADQLGAEITALCCYIYAAEFRLLTLIREFDEQEYWAEAGLCSCAHWLNFHCGIGMNAAREKVRVAHALAKLPKISAAFERGALSYSKVRAMTRVADPSNEDYLLMIAEHGTAHHVERLVSKYRTASRLRHAEPTLWRELPKRTCTTASHRVRRPTAIRWSFILSRMHRMSRTAHTLPRKLRAGLPVTAQSFTSGRTTTVNLCQSAGAPGRFRQQCAGRCGTGTRVVGSPDVRTRVLWTATTSSTGRTAVKQAWITWYYFAGIIITSFTKAALSAKEMPAEIWSSKTDARAG